MKAFGRMCAGSHGSGPGYVPAASLGVAGYDTAFWLPAAVIEIAAGALALWRSRWATSSRSS